LEITWNACRWRRSRDRSAASESAGGVDAAAAVLSLHHGKIPGAFNLTKPAGNGKLNVTPTTRDAQFDVSVSSVYSLGGQNAALVFRKV